jgi:Protein of unknown function (DUF3828)
VRTIFLAVLLVVCGIGEAAAAAEAEALPDPAAHVRSIYDAYQQDKPRAWYAQRYSLRLRKLIQADRKNTPSGDSGKIDWDPIINAHDWLVSAVRVSVVSQTPENAVVDATFRNLGTDEHMRFDLIYERGKWAIDEVQSLDRPRWTMSKILAGAPDAFPDRAAK